jgi:iron complex transport system permease protein
MERRTNPIYRRVTLSRVLQISALLLALLLAICLLSLAIGSVRIGMGSVFRSLIEGLTGGNSLSPQENLIIFSVRLPRILFAGIVGASLSLGGVVFQALLRNPLADPYILGISGGSALGAIIAIVLGAGSFYLGVPFLAFCGGLITVLLVFIVAGGSRGHFRITLCFWPVLWSTLFSPPP